MRFNSLVFILQLSPWSFQNALQTKMAQDEQNSNSSTLPRYSENSEKIREKTDFCC